MGGHDEAINFELENIAGLCGIMQDSAVQNFDIFNFYALYGARL